MVSGEWMNVTHEIDKKDDDDDNDKVVYTTREIFEKKGYGHNYTV